MRTKKDLDYCPAFMIGPTADGPALIIGLPEACLVGMSQGLSNSFDLTKVGIPLKVMLFRSADHDSAIKTIEDFAKSQGIPVFDERRKDFSI